MGHLWGFQLVPLVYISVFVSVSYYLDDCSFIVKSEVRKLDSFSSVFLSQGYLYYSGFFFYFHANCEHFCSSSVKNTVGSLIGIALYLQIALDSIVIFTILILPTQKHGVSLSVCVILVSFTSALQFYAYRSVVLLRRFIPGYFILSVTVMYGTVFLTCISDFSLLL